MIAQWVPDLTISVVSESLPHLKKGAIKDFETILRKAGVYSDKMHNKSDYTYTITGDNGVSKVEFFSADDAGKVTGPRRDILYINEANNVPFEVYDQAEVRTERCIFLDWNPSEHFWAMDKVLSLPSDMVIKLHSTYLNNRMLSPNIVRSIEARKKTDPEWWQVYGLGLMGTKAGLIFSGFKLCDLSEVPVDSPKRQHGMDFGFTNDPSTLIDITVSGDKMYWHQKMYEYAFTNQDIGKRLSEIGLARTDKIVADSSEPKSITELERMGFYVVGAVKGPDSVKNGIDLLKRYEHYITKESTEVIKEFRNYKWKKHPTRPNEYMNVPIDAWNHCIDPGRYTASDMLQINYSPGPARFGFDD